MSDLVWRNVDETTVIPVDPSAPFDQSIFDEYDICVTGAALKLYESRTSWNDLVQNTWVYARVSPSQKEFILTTLKSLGYTTLMAGDGTNDVGALKQADIGVALLDGTPEDLQKIAEHQKNERIKKVYESQLKISARFGQPPPPVPPAIAHLYPNVVEAQKKALETQKVARQKNPMEKVSHDMVIVFIVMLILLFPLVRSGEHHGQNGRHGRGGRAAPDQTRGRVLRCAVYLQTFQRLCESVLLHWHEYLMLTCAQSRVSLGKDGVHSLPRFRCTKSWRSIVSSLHTA